MMGHLRSKGSRRAADGVLGTQLKDTAELQDTLRSPGAKCGWLVSEMGLLRAGSRCGKGRGEITGPQRVLGRDTHRRRKTGTGELGVLQNTQRNKERKEERHSIQTVIQMACWATDLTHSKWPAFRVLKSRIRN